MEMPYNRMGASGLKLSALSLGSWITFFEQSAYEQSLEAMQIAYQAGVNFFDNAENYADGESETVMGRALQELAWPRYSYLVSTKFFWGITDNPNTHWTLNRKYLLESMDKSLERLQLDRVDLVFCHRSDPTTPIEETVWAMSDIVESGRAHYWGTSEWPADSIRAAYEIAERHHLRKPVVEQPEYNLLRRDRVEKEYARLYEDIGLGLTTFSPLAGGALTGKYLKGVPSGTRAENQEWLRERLTNPERKPKVSAFLKVATEVGCSPAQLALAWTASNPNVSSVITGASRPQQVVENMGALEVMTALTEEIREKIEQIFS